MEPISNNLHIKGEANAFQADLEALRTIDSEIYESIHKDLQEADKLWEKARNSLKALDDKEVCYLRWIMKSPHEVPQKVVDVLCACMHLMAGNVPKDCIRVDEKGSPQDISRHGCEKMLYDWKFFRNQMLEVKKLIDEEKISEENIRNVREYLNKEWFNTESMKFQSLPASQFCDAIINIVGYFDMRREIWKKIKTVLGKSEEISQVNGARERED